MSKPSIVRVMKTSKSYNYQIDNLNLNFTLDPKNPNELNNFIIILDEAKKEIEKDIAELK